MTDCILRFRDCSVCMSGVGAVSLSDQQSIWNSKSGANCFSIIVCHTLHRELDGSASPTSDCLMGPSCVFFFQCQALDQFRQSGYPEKAFRLTQLSDSE